MITTGPITGQMLRCTTCEFHHSKIYVNISQIFDFIVTLTLRTPRPSKYTQFICTLHCIINQSLVKIRPLVYKINVLTGRTPGRTDLSTHGSTHGRTTRKHNASADTYRQRRHKSTAGESICILTTLGSDTHHLMKMMCK